MLGGAANIDAETSAQLSALGCFPVVPYADDSGVPYWTAETGGGGGGAPQQETTAYDLPPDVPVSTDRAVYAAPIQEAPVDDFLGLGTIGIPDSPTQISGPSDNFSGYFGSIASIVAPAVSSLLAPSQADPLQGLRDALSPFFQQDQIQTGIVGKNQFPGRCKTSRRKLKIVMQRASDGTLHPQVIAACPPRRMNPLNARALGRSARRLAAFHRISGHIEKIIQHACRKKGRSSSSSRMPASCRSRKRC